MKTDRAADDRLGTGVLVVVGTPIGNLGDLAPRAVEALEAADVICCEDTRRTGRLLQHAGIAKTRLLVVNEHTEPSETAHVVKLLDAGKRVAVVSDGGMPGISDPGERLVRAAVDAGHAVEVVPGPSAAIAGLVLSGLPAGRFAFEGFLPRKGSARTERLAAVATEPRTVVLYEAPHRVVRTLADLVASCGGERRIAVARELTKMHEEVWRGDLAGAHAWATEREPPGEIVLVLDGAPEAPPADDDAVRRAVASALAEGLSVRDAASSVAAELGVARRRAYDVALTLARPPT